MRSGSWPYSIVPGASFDKGPEDTIHICDRAARAAQTAVSVRRIEGPSDAAIHWEAAGSALSRSPSIHPPSGPIIIAAESSFRRSMAVKSGFAPGRSSSQTRWVDGSFRASGKRMDILDIGGAQPARLFARLARNAPPALHAFVRACRQTLLAPAGLNRHDARDAEFGSFLNRPLEPFEFDEREVECYAGKFGAGGDFFDDVEPDQVLASSFNRSQPGAFIVGDFELLARLDPQDPCEVVSVLACDFSLTFANVIDEEAAACHVPCLIHLWRAAIEDGRLVNMTTRSVRIILALRIEIENWETRMKPLCIARLSLFLALAGTAASSLPAQTPVTEAEDGYHFKYWEGSLHNLAYTEWWYFNLYDPGTDTQAIFSYQVLDPSNLAKLGAGALGAVVYQGNNIVPEYDFYPLKSFTASYSAANVTLGSNMISVVGANTYYVTGASRDGRLSWNLFYQREDTSWFAGTHVNVGSAPWEQMSWLLYMPLAKVTGTLTVDGQTSAIDAFPAITITTGDNGTSRACNWNWACEYSQSGLAFDTGRLSGKSRRKGRIEIAGKEVVFQRKRITPPLRTRSGPSTSSTTFSIPFNPYSPGKMGI